jgi:acyl carrier protein
MSASPYTTLTSAEAAEHVRGIVAGVADLDPDEVTDDASLYDDLQVDSLHKLEILVRIERDFGVRLTDVQAAGLATVGDAVTLLRAAGACGR